MNTVISLQPNGILIYHAKEMKDETNERLQETWLLITAEITAGSGSGWAIWGLQSTNGMSKITSASWDKETYVRIAESEVVFAERLERRWRELI